MNDAVRIQSATRIAKTVGHFVVGIFRGTGTGKQRPEGTVVIVPQIECLVMGIDDGIVRPRC